MGYIVDLVVVLTFLAEIHQFPEPTDFWPPIEEDAVNAIKGYTSSKLLHKAHEEIRKFTTVDRMRGITHQDVVTKESLKGPSPAVRSLPP